MRNNFAEKSCTKCGGETIPRPFSTKMKIEPWDLWTSRNILTSQEVWI